MNESYLTGRLRTTVRVLDVLAADLAGGSYYEQAVGRLLSYTAAIIVNGAANLANSRLRRLATDTPRADHAQAEAEAATVAEDALDLPESYSGIGG